MEVAIRLRMLWFTLECRQRQSSIRISRFRIEKAKNKDSLTRDSTGAKE